jgi:hypothetical protein
MNLRNKIDIKNEFDKIDRWNRLDRVYIRLIDIMGWFDYIEWYIEGVVNDNINNGE